MNTISHNDSIRAKNKKSLSRKKPMVAIGSLFCLALLGWYSLQLSTEVAVTSGIPKAPSLFDESTQCPDLGETAISRAMELEEAAMVKEQRYPFHAYEGIKAYELGQLAVACYLAGGERQNAAMLKSKLSTWKSQLKTRYQNHLVRLRLAMDRNIYADALGEVQTLQELLRGKDGAFVQWLASLERELEMTAYK